MKRALLHCCLLLGVSLSASAQDVNDPMLSDVDTASWLSGSIGTRYQQRLVTDADPLNDRALLYTVVVNANVPVNGMSVSLMSGLTERFVVQGNESGWRLQDSSVALNYRHGFGTLNMANQVSFWLPSSRFSQNQGLRLAPTLRTNLSHGIASWLRLNVGAFGQYRWYRYAEQAGQFSGMNPQWSMGANAMLFTTLANTPKWGRLLLSTGLNSQWTRHYASRDDYASTASDTHHWNQGYGWHGRLNYLPRQWATVHAGIRQGASLRRNGVINPVLFHRDETFVDTGLALNW